VDRALVPAGLDNPAEVVVVLALAGEVIANDAVARLRLRLVEGPGATTEVREGVEGTIAVDNDIRKVDGPIAVAFPAEDRSCQWLELARPRDVRQAAHEGDIRLCEFVIRRPRRQLYRASQTFAQIAADEGVEREENWGKEGQDVERTRPWRRPGPTLASSREIPFNTLIRRDSLALSVATR
jgi:hypothetical protein